MGRPSRCTDDAIAKIAAAVRKGAPRTAAAKEGGVSARSLTTWLEKGAKARNGRHRKAYLAIVEAEADLQREVIETWIGQLPGNWQACRDFLARRWPEEWAPHEKREVTTANVSNENTQANVLKLLSNPDFIAFLQAKALEKDNPAPAPVAEPDTNMLHRLGIGVAREQQN